jgi:hypothetical protein
MNVTTALKSPTRHEVLDWMRLTVVEMPDRSIEPHFIRMTTSLDRKTFEYLYERVAARFPLRKKHVDYEDWHTYANFIAQVDTHD